MATIVLNYTGSVSGTFNTNSRMRVTYTAADGTVTISKVEGCRTDGYRTYNQANTSMVITVAGVSKTVSLSHYWDFPASSSYVDFGVPTTSWTGVSSGSVSISFKNPATSTNSNLLNATFSGTITMTYSNHTLKYISDEGVQSVTGTGTYAHGTTATVTVTCKPGYVINYYYGTNWNGTGNETYTPAAGKKTETHTREMYADRTIYVYTTFQGCYIYTSGAWKKAVPYIYTNGAWKESVPYVYKDGAWKIGTG